jgi:hypothetical protein
MAKPELDRFLDTQGRLKSWPAKGRIQAAALEWLVSKLEHDRLYCEREMNELLLKYHTFADPALLRRELFIRRLVDRRVDGSQYWRTDSTIGTTPCGDDSSGAP